MSNLKYRPEIDGLRAIAVAVVVLYHAGFNFFGGGFIGVDIFFVISGFLITSILMKDFQDEGLNLDKFYERRCRRILPPLAFMAVLVTIWAWNGLFYVEFKSYGRSLAAMATFWSNIFFFKSTGYWEVAAESQPLLHTWSLAVEEQFYIIFPLLLWFLYKKFPRRLPLILILLGVLFLMAGEFRLRSNPGAVFYLLHYRAWELLLGAVVALMPSARRFKPPSLTFWGGLGLAALIVPAILYSPGTPFPGLSALMPCLGAALLIYIHGAGLEGSPVGRLLARPVFTALGKISYSLYLWHWPILVARNISKPGLPLETIEACLLISLAVFLAIISYFLVEQPVRQRKILAGRRQIFAASLVGLLVLVAAGRVIRANDGFPERLPAEARLFAEASDFAGYEPRPSVVSGLPDSSTTYLIGESGPLLFAVWGDSHAQHWIWPLEDLAIGENMRGLMLTHGTCPPALDLNPNAILGGLKPDHTDRCRRFNNLALAEIKNRGLKHVILDGRFTKYFGLSPDRPDLERRQGLAQLEINRTSVETAFLAAVRDLQAAGIRVWLLPPIPEYEDKVPLLLARAVLYGQPIEEVRLAFDQHQARIAPIHHMYQSAQELGARMLTFEPELCVEGWCYGADRDGSFYRDYDHLSFHGSMWLQNTFLPFFEALKPDQQLDSSQSTAARP